MTRTPSNFRRNSRPTGPRTRYVCFDCHNPTGNGVEVWRKSDGTDIVWGDESPSDVAIGVIVHRAGTGCHKGQTSSDVRRSGRIA